MTINPPQIFLHYLDRLDALLRQVAAVDHRIALERLHPDMAPLVQQARTAIGFSLRAVCPLAGRDIVSFAGGELTLQNVLSELAAAKAWLAALPASDFAGADTLRVQTTAGFAELDLSAQDYYLMYAVPNFFFHYVMAYAIARQAGIPVGKADFDGYHHYPPGFSFPA